MDYVHSLWLSNIVYYSMYKLVAEFENYRYIILNEWTAYVH